MPRGFEQSLRFRTVLFDQIVNRTRVFGGHYYSRIGDNAARFRTVLFDQIVNRTRVFGGHYYSRIGDNAARFRTVLFDQIVNRTRVFGGHYYSRIGDNAARFRTKFAVSNGFIRSNRESNSRFRGSLLFAIPIHSNNGFNRSKSKSNSGLFFFWKGGGHYFSWISQQCINIF